MVFRGNRSVLRWLVVIALIICLTNYVLSFLCIPNVLRYKLVDLTEDSEEVVHGKKHVLFYTKFFKNENWGMNMDEEGNFEAPEGCPRTNCVFTTNKNLLKHPHEYEAIIFHSGHYENRWSVPKSRSPHQIYVMATLE